MSAPASVPTRGDFVRAVLEIWEQTAKLEPSLRGEQEIAAEWLTRTWTVEELGKPL